MNTTKIIAAVLIIVSLPVGYIAISKISNSTKQVNLLGLHIVASDESAKQQGYLYLGAAILLFAGGIYTLKSNNH